MSYKKNRVKNFIKTKGTNNTTEDLSKSKSSIIAYTIKKQFSKIIYSLKEIKIYVYNNLSKKYNTLPYKYNLMQVDNFISGKYCHSLATFKEKLIYNHEEEFLKKYYRMKEINKSIPLFYEFYKSYLKIFCVPIFSNLPLNELKDKAIEEKAKAFYNENYKDKSNKKEKKLNINIFTSKIRKELSRITNLTNLSKTTIKEGNLTNKSSVTSINSLAKIFNEIDFLENSNNNNNNIIKNKSFKKNNNINNFKNKKNILRIKIKNGNSVKNNNKNNINEKDNSNIIKKNNFTTINKNKINIIYYSNNQNVSNNDKNPNYYFNTEINSNFKCKKIPIKKKSQIIKKNINEKKFNIPTLLSIDNFNINKSQKQYKESPFNNININNKNNKSNILTINTGNNTTKNIIHYNKKAFKKINSRNYQNNFYNNKNSFSKLSGNSLYKMSLSGNKISNTHYLNSLNSINTESIIKLTPKNIIKIKKIDKTKKIFNNKSIEKHNSHKQNIFKKYNNIMKIKIEGEKNKKNLVKNKSNINIKYKKVSPYKKPSSIYGKLNNINNNLGKQSTDKINNINSIIQPKNKFSNYKISWNKKDKNILYKTPKLVLNQYKEDNKNKSKSKK